MTLTRRRLAEKITDDTGFTLSLSGKIVDTIFEKMREGLGKEGKLKLSSFGSFIVRAKKSRMGRNPRTGEDVLIDPRQVVSFKPALTLKAKVRKAPKP